MDGDERPRRLHWKRKRDLTKARRGDLDRLTAEEESNVRAALAVVRARYGTWMALEEALRLHRRGLDPAFRKRGRVAPGLAIRLARLAGVSTDEILSGAFAKHQACPTCGQTLPMPRA